MFLYSTRALLLEGFPASGYPQQYAWLVSRAVVMKCYTARIRLGLIRTHCMSRGEIHAEFRGSYQRETKNGTLHHCLTSLLYHASPKNGWNRVGFV